MVDWRKAFNHISSWDHWQRSSPLRIFDTPRAEFEPAQNLSSGLAEWSCAIVITTTPLKLSEQILFSDTLHDNLYFKIFPSNLSFSVGSMDHFCEWKLWKHPLKSSALANIGQVFWIFVYYNFIIMPNCICSYQITSIVRQMYWF